MAVSSRPGLCVVCFAVPVLTSSSVLAQCLHLLPRSLNVFRSKFPYADPDPHTSYSVLVDPQRDHLCLGIRELSDQLRILLLEGLRISPAIFAGDGDGSYPDWSRLEKVIISYPVISSTGDFTLSPQVLRIRLTN